MKLIETQINRHYLHEERCDKHEEDVIEHESEEAHTDCLDGERNGAS